MITYTAKQELGPSFIYGKQEYKCVGYERHVEYCEIKTKMLLTAISKDI